jgi:hypothetical protein
MPREISPGVDRQRRKIDFQEKEYSVRSMT